MNRMEKVAASRALRDFAVKVEGPSKDVRDSATCLSIALDATAEADRLLTEASEEDVYVVTTIKGFTETFNSDTIDLLVRLGLIVHERDGHVLVDGHGNGRGPVHHFYVDA